MAALLSRIILPPIILSFFLQMPVATPVFSQTKQYVFLEDWTYDLIDYYINNGQMSFDHVLNQPFQIDSVLARREIVSQWFELQKRYYEHFYGTEGYGKAIIYFRDNYSFASSDKKIPQGKLKPPIEDVRLFDNDTKNHFNFAGQINFLFPHLTLVNRTLINSEFKDDPLFYGDTGEWIYGNTNDAYLNAFFGPFDFFVGRMDKNWGTLNEYGLILSNNPYSWDHLQFSYDKPKFKFSMVISRLEDLDARVMEAPDSLFAARKFITLHRVDFSISERLQFALTEAGVYGGPDRDFELAYLNPLNYFYLIQRNQGQLVDGVWALDLFFKPTRNINTYMQFLLDDIIINNDEEDDRARYPDRLGINLKISEADLLLPGLQSSINYTRIWNRTYQTRWTYENYHYREKGLGFPAASTEQLSLKWKYFNLFPAILELEMSYRRFGDVSLTDVFMLTKEEFPVGLAEKSFAIEFGARYFLNHAVWLTSNLSYETFTNYDHMMNNDFGNFKCILGAHFNFSVGYPVN